MDTKTIVRVHHKYKMALRGASDGSTCSMDAASLALYLALEELANDASRNGVGLEDRTAAFHQMTKIGAWLAKNAGGRGEGMEIADAMIAFAEDAQTTIQALSEELEACREGAAFITQQLAPAHAVVHNGNGATPAMNNGGIASSTWLRPEDLDWLEGLNKGRHSFRQVPKDTRRRLAQALIDTVRTGFDAPRQLDFDNARPDWMPKSGGLADTFGVTWQEMCAAKDLPY